MSRPAPAVAGRRVLLSGVPVFRYLPMPGTVIAFRRFGPGGSVWA
ncbi:hypothetical protein [Streptosporangium sp. V21-05]